MASPKRLRRIQKAVWQAKEELFNLIAKHYKVTVPVKLVRPQAVLFGAQGCFEGDVIKINRELPLFWQLIVLEHEIGHFFTATGKQKKARLVSRFHIHKLSSQERRAWEWVDENPIVSGGIIDREVKRYIKKLQVISKKYGHLDYVMRWGWWY